MDPQLGMFIQPDWWEVTKPGVGTNRYAYAGGDPVNGRAPGGNYSWNELTRDVSNFFSGFSTGFAKNADADKTLSLGAAGFVAGAYAGNAGMVAGPAGEVVGVGGGAIVGGAGGLIIGAAGDTSEAIGGGFSEGIDSVIWGWEAEKQALAAKTAADAAKGERLLDRYRGMVSDGTGTHANSLMSRNENELYYLIRKNTTIIDKIGITSAPNAPTGRYTQEMLDRMGVTYEVQARFPDRLSARIAEVGATVAFVAQNGSFPRYTFGW